MNRIEGSIGAFIVAFSFILAGWIGIACQEAPETALPGLPVYIVDDQGNQFTPVDGLLELGPGTFYIDGTIDLGKMEGLQICGAGKTSYPYPTNYDGQCTRIIQIGEGNHFEGEISRFHISNLTLVDGGIHVKASSTLGSGHGIFNNVNFRNSTVEFGDVDKNANAANCTFINCDFRNGTTGVVLNTSQNVDFNFENVYVSRMSEQLIHVKGGGMVDIDGAYVLDCPLLIQVSGAGSHTGPENAKFSVRNVDYDFKGAAPTILHDTHWYGSNDRVLNAESINFNRRNKGTICRWDGQKPWLVNSRDVQNVETADVPE